MNKIIIGDDGELPDAIDAGELAPLASGAPPVDPRLRSRRIGVRRAEGRRRLVYVLAGGVVLLVVIAVLAVLASPLFSIDRVRVTGAVYTTDEVLAPIIAQVEGDPVLTVDTNAVRRQIEALPWVRRAEVHADFPRTLVIDIDERTPAAVYLGGDGRWRVIDRSGRVIAVELGQPIDYLAIEGAGPDLEPGGDAGPPFTAMGELAETIRDLPELSAVVDRLTLSAAGDFGMVWNTDAGTVVNLGPATNLRAKLAVLITLMRQGEVSDATSVDLSNPNKPAIDS